MCIVSQVWYRNRTQEMCQDHPKYLSTVTSMKCYYLHNSNPFLVLGPFKSEMLNGGNEIGLIHDFASKTECKHVIKQSLPLLKSTPYVVEGKMLNVSRKRTSKNVMFTGDEDNYFKSLNERIQMATRMNTNEKQFQGGEKIQV